jgi:phthalate 4,5-dioxygenase oxygenase subunit
MMLHKTNYGFRYAAIRTPIVNADTHDYVRITTYIAPFTAVIPPNSSYKVASVIVPKDDASSYFHFIAWNDEGNCIEQDEWRKFCVAQPGIDLDRNFRLMKRTKENDYLQDRNAMLRGDYTGIPGIPNQDIMMWESMGSIADRDGERLGTSDLAIVQFRRLMIDAAQTFVRTGQVIGRTEPRIPQAQLKSFQGIVPKGVNWPTLAASEIELSTLGIASARVAQTAE